MENVLTDIELVAALVPTAIQLFESLKTIFGGDKNKAMAAASAAVAHPQMTPVVAERLQAALQTAHQVG